jgi:hypothetical protein
MQISNSGFTRALRVFKGDGYIPSPDVIATGLATTIQANAVINANANFISQGVKEGDIIFCSGLEINVEGIPAIDFNQNSAVITKVHSATTLYISRSILSNSPLNAYKIHRSSDFSGGSNVGCTVFVSINSSFVSGPLQIQVETKSGDDFIYTIDTGAKHQGAFTPTFEIPVKVRRIKEIYSGGEVAPREVEQNVLFYALW